MNGDAYMNGPGSPVFDGITPVFIVHGADPTVPPGFQAPIGSILKFGNAYYQKYGAGATDWQQFAVAAGVSSYLTVATIAALTALNVAALPDGTTVWVRSLKDFFVIRTAADATDATNFLVVASSDAARRWFRQCQSSAEWATTLTWFVDPAGGNNENAGATVGAPLRTLSELERRLRGQTVIGNQTVTLAAGTFAQVDPIRVTWNVQTSTFGRGTLTIQGTRTVAASYTLTAVTGQNGAAAAGGQELLVTAVGMGAAEVDQLIRFQTAGGAFRAIGWGKRDVGGGQISVSNPWPVDGAVITSLGTTNPVVGDTAQRITLTTVTGFQCEVQDLQVVLLNLAFVNAAGISIADVATPYFFGSSGPSKMVDCSFASATVFCGWQAYNCRFTGASGAGSLSFMRKWCIRTCFFSGGASFTATFSDGSGFLDANTAFQNCGVLLRRCMITDAQIAFFGTTATLVDLQDTAQIEFDLLWGNTGNTGKAINMGDAGGRMFFQNAAGSLNLVTTGTGITGSQSNVTSTLAALTYECFRDSGDNLIAAPSGFAATLPNAHMGQPLAIASGAALGLFKIVRIDPATGQAVLAQANNAANASYVLGVMASLTGAAAQAASYVCEGHKVVQFDADPNIAVNGAIAYLSAANAGNAVDVPPAAAGTNQKLRLGIIEYVFGGGTGLAVVRLDIETFPVVSNGVAP